MCRIAAFIGDLERAGPYVAAFREFGEKNPHGYGFGAFVDGNAQLWKHTESALESGAYGQMPWLDDTRSMVAHVRKATVGGVNLDNTHPFHVGDLIVAHNGTFGEVDQVDARLGIETLRRLGVRGDTDSERFAALLAHQTAAAGGDEIEGYRRTVAYLSDHHPMTSLTSVSIDPNGDFTALRYPENRSLFWKRLGIRDADNGYQLVGDKGGLTVFASRPLDATAGWQELPPGMLMRVRAKDLREEFVDVIHDEPMLRYTDGHEDPGMPGLGRRRSTMVHRELTA